MSLRQKVILNSLFYLFIYFWVSVFKWPKFWNKMIGKIGSRLIITCTRLDNSIYKVCQIIDSSLFMYITNFMLILLNILTIFANRFPQFFSHCSKPWRESVSINCFNMFAVFLFIVKPDSKRYPFSKMNLIFGRK